MDKLVISQFSKDELQEFLLKPILGRIDKIEAEFEKSNTDSLYTREQTSEYFNVDLSTLHRWTKQRVAIFKRFSTYYTPQEWYHMFF